MTLEDLVAGCRQALSKPDQAAGRRDALALVAAALRDPGFVQAQFTGPPVERRLLHEDPDLGFCILAHEFTAPRGSTPHDHGPSWAIYGQAAGETFMTDFDLVEPATPDRPGKVRKTRSYRLGPGDVHLYNEGDLHAPSRAGPTRLIRIEGMNMDRIVRSKYEAVEG